jgi:hypothetical protein
MPTVRQVLTGLPPQRGATAFMPVRAMTPSVMDISRSQGTPEEVTGQPGTMGIPAPYPAATSVGHEGGYDKLPSGLSESRYMPARWYPSIYYRAQHLSMGIGGVRVYSDNQMPVPAVDPRGLPSGVIGPVGFAAYPGLTPTTPARPQRWVAGLGQRQVSWPRRMPFWPGSWSRDGG